MYNNINFNDLFDNESEYGKKFKQNKLTEEQIKRAEELIIHKLPNSYKEFLKIQNGGYIRNDESWLTAIYGIGENEESSKGLESMYNNWINNWEYPKTVVPFGETQSGGHDMYCMDYTDVDASGEPKIIRVSNEDDNSIYFVANSFQEFINMAYSNKNISGKLKNDEKKLEQKNIDKKLNDLNGNIALCRCLIFIDVVILILNLLKLNLPIIIICIVTVLIIIPFLIKYEKEYKSLENKVNK